MVDGVWKVLRLQAKAGVLRVELAIGSGQFSVEEVAGIELDARRADAHFQSPARHWLLNHRRRAQVSAQALAYPPPAYPFQVYRQPVLEGPPQRSNR